MNGCRVCEAELAIAVEHRCRPDLDDIDAANLLHLIDGLRKELADTLSANADWAAVAYKRATKLSEREAEIVMLRGYLHQISKMSANPTINNACSDALSTTQSTSYLEQWEKERYRVVGYYYRDDPAMFSMPGSGYSHKYPTNALDIVPLYARKD